MVTPWLDFGRHVCGNPRIAARREWLVTNGLGSFAAGTIGGQATRRYHGLLIAALDPPQARTLLVAAVDAVVTYRGQTYELATHRWEDGTLAPTGYRYLERFHLEGTVPVWTYALADALLERRVWMEQGAQTTYVQYRLVRGAAPVHLRGNVLVNGRDFHGTTQAHDGLGVESYDARHIAFGPHDGTWRCALHADSGALQPAATWYRGMAYAVEQYRGLNQTEDHLHAATLEVTLEGRASCALVSSLEGAPDLNAETALQRRRQVDADLLARADLSDAPPRVQHLALAADQFVVARETPVVPDGRTVIAGYPWFGDWGRDTMIALPGLTLATGRPEVAAHILRTFAHYVDGGMLPNRFPDVGETPEYNTVDAALWFVEAIRAYHAATDDLSLVSDLFPTLRTIVEAHVAGTRYGIRLDPGDGLLRAGEPGVQLTWMDAKVGDWVVTPRIGKPVEINALWYHALCTLADFAQTLGEDATLFEARAEASRTGFTRFWNAEAGYLYDVLDGPEGDDASLRPNQLFAVSLAHSPLPPDLQRAVVDVCAAHLLTSHGLRSLAPADPAYIGHYGGGPRERDGAYHQGTVWGWLIGPFVAAHFAVYRDTEKARAYLGPLLQHLDADGVGTMSEIFDGDAPHAARGTFAQAWTVAEVLRTWRLAE